ncbi:MAG: HipA domain-containing protein [Lachnospiraceae bacterium]|nr:HipA domain-containing protein [Lachnospiraceae bacterium]
MCFNVFAHNRDDHAKNFSFMYDEKSDKWKLSPAYDLTYSNTYWGEHTTSVDGNGKNPETKELLSVGVRAGLKKDRCERLIEEVRGKVEEDLHEYI